MLLLSPTNSSSRERRSYKAVIKVGWSPCSLLWPGDTRHGFARALIRSSSVCLLLFMCELLSGWTAHLWQAHCTIITAILEGGICKNHIISDHAQHFILQGFIPLFVKTDSHLIFCIPDPPGYGAAAGALGFLVLNNKAIPLLYDW